jgi:antitoxin HicB
MKMDHSGSSFDSFLQEERIKEEVEAVAVKRVIAWQFEQAMLSQKKTKQAMAKQLHTSRTQLNRLLDPKNAGVTLETISRAANVLGKKIIIKMVDAKREPANSILTPTIPMGAMMAARKKRSANPRANR